MIERVVALGDITLDEKAKIDAARAAYDALTDDQKKLVDADVLAKLTKAEADYAKVSGEDAEWKLVQEKGGLILYPVLTDGENGQAMTNYWFTDKKSGKTYYFDANGFAERYRAVIDGAHYYFNSKGEMQAGLIMWKADGCKSFFDLETGKDLKSQSKVVLGTKYYFDENGYTKK